MAPLALVYLECIKSDVLVLCNGKNSKIYVLPGIDSSKRQPERIPFWETNGWKLQCPIKKLKILATT